VQLFYQIRKQLIHAISTLERAYAMNSRFILFSEDDFPLCPNRLHRLLKHMCALPTSNNDYSGTGDESCGLFAATGGSGFVFTRKGALEAINYLKYKLDHQTALELGERNNTVPSELVKQLKPHDLLLHQCISGDASTVDNISKASAHKYYCSVCKGHAYATATLYFYHTGAKSSTVYNRETSEDQWQCGWRNPFTEHPNVHIVW